MSMANKLCFFAAAVSARCATVQRETTFGYNKGQTAFLIDDAESNTWIRNIDLHSTETYEGTADLGSRPKLPPGWKFRVQVLPEDLVLIPETATAMILAHDLNNVYDRTGPGYSNYKP